MVQRVIGGLHEVYPADSRGNKNSGIWGGGGGKGGGVWFVEV